MNNIIKENWDIIEEKIIKPMYENGYFPLTVADEISKLLSQQLNNGWIPVDSENLPGRYERVHVHVTLKHVDGQHEFTAKMIWWLGKFQWANGKEISEKYRIIAWMPERSPEPYKEEFD